MAPKSKSSTAVAAAAAPSKVTYKGTCIDCLFVLLTLY